MGRFMKLCIRFPFSLMQRQEFLGAAFVLEHRSNYWIGSETDDWRACFLASSWRFRAVLAQESITAKETKQLFDTHQSNKGRRAHRPAGSDRHRAATG